MSQPKAFLPSLRLSGFKLPASFFGRKRGQPIIVKGAQIAPDASTTFSSKNTPAQFKIYDGFKRGLTHLVVPPVYRMGPRLWQPARLEAPLRITDPRNVHAAVLSARHQRDHGFGPAELGAGVMHRRLAAPVNPLSDVITDDVVTGPGFFLTDVESRGAGSGAPVARGVRLSVAATQEEKIAALVNLAAEISVTTARLPSTQVLVNAFQVAGIAGIGDLALAALYMPKAEPDLKLFYRNFVLNRAEKSLSLELYSAFSDLVYGVTTQETFKSVAGNLRYAKPLTGEGATLTLAAAKPDFIRPELTRTEVLNHLIELFDALDQKPLPRQSAQVVSDKLHALGLRGFDIDLAIFVGALRSANVANESAELTEFVKARLERVLSPELFTRFVYLLHSHNYEIFLSEAEAAPGEAIWAVDAAPAASGDAKGGQGHSRERQQAEEEE